MSTNSIEAILTREIKEKPNIDFSNKASEYLIEIVNFSTHAFHWYLEETKNKYKENENLAIPTLFLNSIELVDGIQELTKIGLVNPCAYLVRSLFEVYLSIRLLLENRDLYIERSLSWLVFCAHLNIDSYQDIARGEIKRINETNEVKIPIDFDEIENRAKDKIEILNELLSREQFKNIEKNYVKNKRILNWFQLIDPSLSSIRAVAKRFRCEQEYLFFYKPYSRVVHGSDYQRFIRRISGREKNTCILRDRTLLLEIPGNAGNLMILIINYLFLTFLRGKRDLFKHWYLEDLKRYPKFIWKEYIVFE